MAYGTPAPTEDSIVRVGSANPPTLVVGGLMGWSLPNTKPTTIRKYIGQGSFTTTGTAESAPELTCDYESADTGQGFLCDSWDSGALIYIQALPDGVNGEVYPVKLSARPIAGPDNDSNVTINFSFAQQGPPTVTGSGMGA